MSLIGQFMNQYPLAEHYRVCSQYMKRGMDWRGISDALVAKNMVAVDVSNAISFFAHLELDRDYKLICYLTSEYHGIWGRVAAVKTGEDWEPEGSEDSVPASRLLFGRKLILPKCAVPPMEAIYHDGTKEGYFEAVLCSLFLQALPYTRFEQDCWHIIQSAPPERFDNEWNSRIEIADWRPRYAEHSIIAYRRKVENGLGSSSGKDRIYLSQFNFHSSVNHYMVINRDQQSLYHNHLSDSKRYNNEKRCCLFTTSSVLVAEEKHYTAV